MHYADSFDEVRNFAEKAHSLSSNGKMLLSQSETTPDELFFGDEDMGRSLVPQILSVMLETESGTIFYEYTFFTPEDLEEANLQLHSIEAYYPKVIVERDDIERLILESSTIEPENA